MLEGGDDNSIEMERLVYLKRELVEQVNKLKEELEKK